MVGGGLECQFNSGIRSVGQQHSFLWWHGSDCWLQMIRMQHEIWILMNMVVELYKFMSIFLLLFYITLLNVRKLWTRIIESKNLSYKYRSTLMKPIELHSLVVDDVHILGYRCGFDLVPLSTSSGFPSTISRSTFKRRILSQLFLHPSPRVIIAWKMEAWNSGKNTTSA